MNVAFIPVRGGSKSIHLKNIRMLCGRPLVYWVLKAASKCEFIDYIYVATDSDEIKWAVKSMDLPKVVVIGRSAENATDIASTESAMLEFSDKYNFDNIILIQATSPLLSTEDLYNGIQLYNQDNVDGVLSAVRQKRFHWKIDEEGFARADNYDVFHRPRRQEFEGYWVENGAFYITAKERLLKYKNRISGNIKICEMCEESLWEIDEPQDWFMIEQLLNQRIGKKRKRFISEIKMFLTDCDGCLTDGGMYYSENGDELKRFNTLDGMGFSLLREHHIVTGIITGEDQMLNRRRAEKLNIDILKMGVKDKLQSIRELAMEYGIEVENIAYVGDDINDLEAVQNVGYGCSVSNGIEAVKKVAKYVSHLAGGQGAVREIIDVILEDSNDCRL